MCHTATVCYTADVARDNHDTRPAWIDIAPPSPLRSRHRGCAVAEWPHVPRCPLAIPSFRAAALGPSEVPPTCILACSRLCLHTSSSTGRPMPPTTPSKTTASACMTQTNVRCAAAMSGQCLRGLLTVLCGVSTLVGLCRCMGWRRVRWSRRAGSLQVRGHLSACCDLPTSVSHSVWLLLQFRCRPLPIAVPRQNRSHVDSGAGVCFATPLAARFSLLSGGCCIARA